jgi:hypothetical protein
MQHVTMCYTGFALTDHMGHIIDGIWNVDRIQLTQNSVQWRVRIKAAVTLDAHSCDCWFARIRTVSCENKQTYES